jgi:perosamine synthetase
MNIPLSRPDISEADIEAVVQVMRTAHLSLGPKGPEFEEAICRYTGARFATAVNSGTSALHLAVRALGIRDGDEVVTSPFSFVASANCMLFERATPVFADIDPVTMNIDAEAIERAITPRTRAILPVHVFGLPCNMDRILEIARQHGVFVIEDACEAIGASWRDRSCGTFGDTGVFAFYPNKQITTGEGGVLVTDDDRLDRAFKSLRNQGRGTDGAWLQHERMGYNYRLSDLNSALGLSQLQRLDEILQLRQQVADLYRNHLAAIEEIALPVYEQPHSRVSWFVYVIRLRSATRQVRDRILQQLRAAGIACSNYFSPIHLQPYFQKMGYRAGQFPVTEAVGDSTIALPFYNRLTEADVRVVADALKQALYDTRQEAAHSVSGSVLQRT